MLRRASQLSLFLSTLPARGATNLPDFATVSQLISIHAPREGSDRRVRRRWALRHRFLSTLPARGATPQGPAGPPFIIYFYPRSPRGERPSTADATSP